MLFTSQTECQLNNSALYFGCTKATLILYRKEFEGGFALPAFCTATFILGFTIFYILFLCPLIFMYAYAKIILIGNWAYIF